jgi:hypothetical protein
MGWRDKPQMAGHRCDRNAIIVVLVAVAASDRLL